MIKVIILDIDGVFTDGDIIVDEDGKEYKSYNLTELDTLHELKNDGYRIIAITGEDSSITKLFKERFCWDDFIEGCKNKVSGIKSLEKKINVLPEQICYVGDGKYDVPAIEYVGVGVAPANAIDEAKKVADIVLSGMGGKDCIRELRKVLLRLENQKGNPSVDFQENLQKVSALDKFYINSRVCIITGGGGLMGCNHAEAVLAGDGIPVLLDISQLALCEAKEKLLKKYPFGKIKTYCIDITNRCALENIREDLLNQFNHIDVLINNAANNPQVEKKSTNMGAVSFPEFPVSSWCEDISVGLTGALLCTQVFGEVMAKQEKGVILNISSDLGVIAPDQRIYRRDGLKDEEQIIKPVTYSVIKHGLIGLTKYVATYWADKGVRCNALCPAGIENGQDETFIKKLTNLVPMGRMASKDEYQSTVLYMISDASAYMTGATVVVDGGRTCW